jgi:hypothetical protein
MNTQTKRNLFEAIILFFAQLILCTVIAINYRAIAQGNYLFTALSAGAIAYITYFLIQRISNNTSENHRDFAWIGFMLGSIAGDLTGIFLSKIMLGS